MTERKRSSKQLEQQLKGQSYDEFCIEILEKFANTDMTYRRSKCSEEFNISKDCFYTIVDYSIIENVISEKTMKKVIQKIIEIQKEYQEIYKRSLNADKLQHYKKLKKQRYDKILSSFSSEKIKEVSEYFANHIYKSKEEVSKLYEIEIQVLDLILKKAIIENIVDDFTFILIKERSLSKDNSKRAIEIFEQLCKARENNKNKVT